MAFHFQFLASSLQLVAAVGICVTIVLSQFIHVAATVVVVFIVVALVTIVVLLSPGMWHEYAHSGSMQHYVQFKFVFIFIYLFIFFYLFHNTCFVF